MAFAVLIGLVLNAPARSEIHRRFNFETDIEPILTKFGCNGSGCHGKAEGQNGFKLSVFSSDPLADHRSLTVEARGRRLFPAAAERSLLLLKVSGGLPHGGGIRIEPHQREYSTLRDWIATGAPLGTADDPKLVHIRVDPREHSLALRQSQTLRVSATWSDGRETDVTALATFESNDDTLAEVDATGLITACDRPGTVAVMARYLGQIDVFQAIIPRSQVVEPYPAATQHNFIDRLVDERLRKLHIVPSPVADDGAFLRRVFLDVIGTLPTSNEAREFLADTKPNKRSVLVDRLLDRPEFAEYWALKWADMLRVDREVLGHQGAYDFYRWIRDGLSAKKPLDQFAREIITAEGPLSENPAGQLFKAVPQPGDAAATISQVFLGVRIACAQCHHHPYDRWDQADYLGMQAYFTPLQRRATPFGEALVSDGNPTTSHPRTHQPVYAHTLGSKIPEQNLQGDRRHELASWLTSRENRWFARNLVNRIWSQFMGRGLVEPVDDFRATNPPSHPELLDALADHFVAANFEPREFIRTVTASRVYQQSTATNSSNADDDQGFSRARLRRLDAEVLLDAICQTTGVPEKFEGAPAGLRAIQLWDGGIEHYFLSQFGRPRRKTACECERQIEPSVAQVLHLLNSERVHRKLAHDLGTVARLERTIHSDPALVEELYLTYFSRFPTPEERQRAGAYLAATSSRRDAAEDLAWSLLNALEFVFNH